MYACHDGLIHNLRLDHYLDTKWTFHKQNYVLNIQFLRQISTYIPLILAEYFAAVCVVSNFLKERNAVRKTYYQLIPSNEKKIIK